MKTDISTNLLLARSTPPYNITHKVKDDVSLIWLRLLLFSFDSYFVMFCSSKGLLVFYEMDVQSFDKNLIMVMHLFT